MLEQHWGEDLIELSEEDASVYAANSFTFEREDECFLVMLDAVSQRLIGQVRERGVTRVTVDVSEFLKKGGGSVKCMLGDLGIVQA